MVFSLPLLVDLILFRQMITTITVGGSLQLSSDDRTNSPDELRLQIFFGEQPLHVR